ncbi:MAG: hypothetical protein JXP34_13745, partial [Planctomycetes bacterium]|nr:hypothetical protein [Planctomycetota bacterium]
MARVMLAALAAVALAAGPADADCIDFFLKGCPDGDPQQYECLQVTTTLSPAKGGEAATIEQEQCFGHNGSMGSPLPERIEIFVDRGTLDVSMLSVGTVFGLAFFKAKFSDFGESCPLGDEALLEAPFVVTERNGDEVLFEVRIETANQALIQCLLDYDPTDADHNDGLMYTGVMAPRAAGGFEMLLELSVNEDNGSTAIGAGDRVDPAVPVPLTFRYMDAEETPGIFAPPVAGGKLTVSTVISGLNASASMVEFEQDEVFDIEGSPEGKFRRGDVDANGTLTIGDPIGLLDHLFADAPEPSCPDAADIDDNGSYTI